MKKYIALHNIHINEPDYKFYNKHKCLYTKQKQSVNQIHKNWVIPLIIRDHINLPEYSNKFIPYLDKKYLEFILDSFVSINIAKSFINHRIKLSIVKPTSSPMYS